MDPASRLTFYNNACSQKKQIALMEREFGPVIVGEWSLATDNCAMWLNGFNDNLPGFPRSPCKYIPCSSPYMGEGQPGTPVESGKPIQVSVLRRIPIRTQSLESDDFDEDFFRVFNETSFFSHPPPRSSERQGPYGTGMSGPMFGLCPVDRDWMTERYNRGEDGTSWVTASPEAPRGRDGTDEVMSLLAMKKISAFSGIGHGFYFWNFRTDLYNPQWSYMLALERGWIPKGDLSDPRVINSCQKEDVGAFVCEAKRDATEDSVRVGMSYALGVEGKDADYVKKLHDDGLYDQADVVFGEFWESHRAQGATCDFGGAAVLSEKNKTHTEDYYTDDYYNVLEINEFPIWKIVLFGFFGVAIGGLTGFTLAMKLSPKFNRTVRSSTMLRPVTSSRLFRQSFGNLLEPGFTGIDFD